MVFERVARSSCTELGASFALKARSAFFRTVLLASMLWTSPPPPPPPSRQRLHRVASSVLMHHHPEMKSSFLKLQIPNRARTRSVTGAESVTPSRERLCRRSKFCRHRSQGGGLIMQRRLGNSFMGSYNEELRGALAGNPNFVQAPNCRGSYVGTGAEAASDPLYTPTAKAVADMEGVESPVQAATLPRRSKRLRPFYVDREVEPASANRRTRETRELLFPRETIRERPRLLLIQVSSSSSDSEGSAGSQAGRRGAGRSITRSTSSEFADDNFPPNNTASAVRNQTIPKSPESEATVTTPRAHRRKQNRPYRGPVM